MMQNLRLGERFTGQMGLVKRLGLQVPPPYVVSIVGAVARKTEMRGAVAYEWYRRERDYGDDAISDLKFAMRNEPFDLCLLSAAMRALPQTELVAWIASEQTSVFARRAWFLFEFLTGEKLPLPVGPTVKYAPLLDEKFHVAGAFQWKDSRTHILVNLLGVQRFCPIVRRTPKINGLSLESLLEEIALVTRAFSPELLRRAADFLYSKETRSSFEIEREAISENKGARFVAVLRTAGEFGSITPDVLLKIQSIIIGDEKRAARGWRAEQNYIGETQRGFQENVHCIFPRPEDVPLLMDGLEAMDINLDAFRIDPIVTAAILAFSFVFIHPFDDGNGRIHRFLIHHALVRHGVTPAGGIFPVSAAMLRDPGSYDRALEAFSSRIMPFIEWRIDEDGVVTVQNDTLDLYRFFDATAQVEYLADVILETVRVDLRQELEYLQRFDRIYPMIDERLDGVPRNKVNLLISLCLQNNGRLAKGKRRHFPMLSDEDVADVERLIAEADAEEQA
jgi:Fic family protein